MFTVRSTLPTISTIATRGMSTIPQRLNGQVAIVTASTDGIGYAIARRLGQEGAKVMVSSRKEANVQKAVDQLQSEKLDVKGVVCHVGKAEDRTKLIDQCISEFGGLDVLVSNAAVNPHFGSILDSKASHWDKLLDVNIKAAFLLCQEAMPHIEKRNGNIVIVSSLAGYVPLFERIASYSVTKTALLSLVKALATECAKKNVRVNGIAPGIIKTSFSSALMATKKIEQEVCKLVPLGRLGAPEDVASAAAFLVAPEAAYVTGETIVVGGGMSSRL